MRRHAPAAPSCCCAHHASNTAEAANSKIGKSPRISVIAVSLAALGTGGQGRGMDDLFSPRGRSGRRLACSNLASLAGGAPQVVTNCDLEGADLSGLELTGWRFQRCNLRKADCSRTKLGGLV